MIDFKAWAEEEKERAEVLRENVGAYFPEHLEMLVHGRIAQHEERAQFLTKQAEGTRW